jgi:hypothetical protein
MPDQLPALPEPALKRMPTGNVYFTPQQMEQYALDARKAALQQAAAIVKQARVDLEQSA